FSRASGTIQKPTRFAYLASSGLTGSHTSARVRVNHGPNVSKPAGITPTTVETTSSMRNVFPSTAASPWNFVFHSVSLITTVSESSCASSARKALPKTGCTPTRVKKLGVTYWTGTCTGSPSPATVDKPIKPTAPTPEKT